MRYVAKARRTRSDWLDEEYPLLPSLQVYEDDDQPTGVLDSQGNEYYRTRDRIGFKPHG